ncbi:MAG: ABC transporter ATP-binding protein [Acidobacteriota bacterium]|nr:ABC transporter ATP-binding protein [Acidobacteriota bacterium]
MSDCLLEGKNVTKHYDEGRIQALRGVDLAVNASEFVAITGPSGSGKSTLLQLLGGLDQPTSGEILFRGHSLANSFDLDSYRSRRVGFVFQAFHLLPTLRALENVQIPMFETKLGLREREAKAAELLREVGLEHRLQQYPNQLSAGERQRTAIARSLANDPEILLADEPTGNLDSENSAKIMALLTGIQAKRNMVLVIVTHESAIAQLAQRTIHIRDGRISS